MRIFNHFSYLLVVAFLSVITVFSSCQKDDLDNPIPKPINEANNRQVSYKQAEAFASLMANNLFTSDENGAQLKSTTADIVRAVEEVDAIVTESKDTVMFSVNFENSKGFMIISGDKGDNPIIALSDSGSFDIDNLNATAQVWVSEQKEYISDLMKHPFDEEDGHSVWEGIGCDSSTVEISYISELPKLKACRPDGTPSGRHTVYPYTGMVLKWGQEEGYNYDAKINGALAGCPAVAVGMLCYDHWFPSNYYYLGMPYELSSKYENRSSHISRMFRSIADKIPSYNWGKHASGSTPNNTLTGIKRLGYSNAKLIDFNLYTVYENLKKGYPVLLRSYQNGIRGGHIWFCDGYWEAKVEIKHRKRKWYGKKYTHCTWHEYHDYLYMNWGWDGKANGWYRSDENGHWKPKKTNFNYRRQAYIDLYPVG